ncbi:SDR family NAD(P)-dependent oxidoreductase [Calidifontibacter sp. DB0510]|uniref:SDR family NAD(P)-dependent oxidoreductase n=1 Tax=Metallococcus carri TaxID=1656884 RepID=A0A967B2K4_9MICO|nr:SDR family NAD(P)-dependent oxidoreductase [Metallococcus carri]NHN56225.1 SDR family NAD(P)-dependent oxidoreductase [Metallococcus carri]NOP38724.1 SDR family NAD(P)-dependent oxidoreductase [Calidifontibacter sp. DB2511S]
MTTAPSPVLITGCSTGIGRATAERLARKGLTVYATARKVSDLEGLADVIPLPLDVTDEASMRAVVEQIEAEHGAVGALVNNAGYGVYGPIEEAPMTDVRKMFDTNVFGLVELTRLVLPGMRRAGRGRIVNIGSMGGKVTFPIGGFYHATKYAVEALTDALRQEVAQFGIQVSLVEPGPIRTNFESTISRSAAYDGADGPYAGLVRRIASTNSGAYANKLVAPGPESVAKAIEKALTARNPRTRYLLTPAAHVMVGTHAVVPDRVWDTLVRVATR